MVQRSIVDDYGRWRIDARIESIFFEKNSARSSAVKLDVDTEAGFNSG